MVQPMIHEEEKFKIIPRAFLIVFVLHLLSDKLPSPSDDDQGCSVWNVHYLVCKDVIIK